MQFFYGSYFHPANEVAITSFQRSYIDGQTGRHSLLKVVMALEGKIVLKNPTVSALMGELAARQDAYSLSNKSCGFVDANAGLIQPWFMDTAQSAGGLLVTNPVSHGKVTGAEGTTYLRYTFAIEGHFLMKPNILSFQETVSFSDIGGGPLTVEKIPIQGQPIIQYVSESSWFHATQTGNLTQNRLSPTPQAPIWPYALRGNDSASVVTYTPIKTIRGSVIESGVTWKYDFISPYPLNGGPGFRG